MKQPALPGRWSSDRLLVHTLRVYNAIHRLFLPNHKPAPSVLQELNEIREFAAVPSDIDEHLELMFTETLLRRPKLIVELGVRGGTSTFVFERAANLCGASLISVDIDDCSDVSSYPRWHFFQGDDIAFASMFRRFCGDRNIPASIDLLFIDTSHYYDHTLEEINAWFPHLSPGARIMFHDTNMGLTGRRSDGCFQSSWDNQRGVTQAIEKFLSITIDETRDCYEFANGWLLRHKANCNGFTILDDLASQVNLLQQ
jgi:cephalosporin hydroxylase